MNIPYNIHQLDISGWSRHLSLKKRLESWTIVIVFKGETLGLQMVGWLEYGLVWNALDYSLEIMNWWICTSNPMRRLCQKYKRTQKRDTDMEHAGNIVLARQREDTHKLLIRVEWCAKRKIKKHPSGLSTESVLRTAVQNNKLTQNAGCIMKVRVIIGYLEFVLQVHHPWVHIIKPK